ncbi:hypothetical protein YPPY64_3680, partial [Yersinia pestis PY-64]
MVPSTISNSPPTG